MGSRNVHCVASWGAKGRAVVFSASGESGEHGSGFSAFGRRFENQVVAPSAAAL
jgi:hypothetical protein